MGFADVGVNSDAPEVDTDGPAVAYATIARADLPKHSLRRSISFAVQDDLSHGDKPAAAANAASEHLPNHLGTISLQWTFHCVERDNLVENNALNVPMRMTVQSINRAVLEMPAGKLVTWEIPKTILASASHLANSNCEFWVTVGPEKLKCEIRWPSADPASLRSPDALRDVFVQMFWVNSAVPFIIHNGQLTSWNMNFDNLEAALVQCHMLCTLAVSSVHSLPLAMERKLEAIKVPATFDIIPNSQPEKPFALKLYDYQLRTFAWMQGIEDGEQSLFYAPNVVELDNDLYMDIKTQRIFEKKQDDEQNRHLKDITVKSGIIADKPGVGKTIVTLALCHSRPFVQEEKDFLNELHPKTSLFLSRATAIFLPNNVANQWEQEIQKCLGKTVSVVQIKGKRQYSQAKFVDLLTSDFVIITYQFLVNPAYKGAKNVARDFESRIRSHKLKDNPDSRKKFVEQTAETDYCFNWIHFHRIVADEFHEITDKTAAIGTQMREMRANHFWGLTGTPRFETFPTVTKFADFLNLNATATWSQLGVECLRLIEQRVRRNEPEVQFPPPVYETIGVAQSPIEGAFYRSCISSLTPVELLKLCNHYQIGNAAASLGMHNVMSIDSVTRLVQETRAKEIERLLNRIAATSSRAADAEEALEALESRGHDGTREGKERFNSKRRALKHQIAESEVQIAQDRITLTPIQAQFNYFENFVNSYLSNADNKVECGICLDDNVIGDIGIVPCGHLFCWECAQEVVRTHGLCPTCRDRVQQGEVMKVLSPATMKILENELNDHKDEVADEGEKTLDPDMFGSKIREMVKYLRTEMEKSSEFRFVVFIQFSDLADLVSKALNTFGIGTARFKSGWPQRESALKRFRAGLPIASEGSSLPGSSDEPVASEEDNAEADEAQQFLEPDSKDKGKRSAAVIGTRPMKIAKRAKPKKEAAVRVLMLSAKDSVSGLNLTEASHCILLHPFHSDVDEYAVASEKQGIARLLRNGQTKTVKIVRFYVEGTIEAQIHESRVRAQLAGGGEREE